MILRRIIEHVKAQNWTAVALDFLIVVMGVFIGIQVSNWNQVRKDRAEERIILDRLAAEIAGNFDATIRVLNFHREREEILRNVVKALKEDIHHMPSEAETQYALCRWFVVPTSKIETNSFDELVSSGKLNLIRDAELRRLIMAAYASHKQSGHQIDLLADTVRAIAVELSPFISWEIENRDSDGDGYHCTFDFPGMAADPKALSVLTQLARGQQNYATFRRSEADADEIALSRLKSPEGNHT